MTGLVRTADGRPRAGAHVAILGTKSEEVAQCTTDDAGRFEMRDLAGGTYTVLAISMPYEPAVTLFAGSGGHTTVELVLEGAGVITGVLRGGLDHAPIPGARVQLIGADDRPSTEMDTDQSGQFRFEKVAEGAWTVRAERPGCRPAEAGMDVSAGDLIERDLNLVPLGQVEGEVRLHDGMAVGQARVALVRPDGHVVTTATTDRDGRYRSADVDAGTYVVVCMTVEPEPEVVMVEPGQTTNYSVRVTTMPEATLPEASD